MRSIVVVPTAANAANIRLEDARKSVAMTGAAFSCPRHVPPPWNVHAAQSKLAISFREHAESDYKNILRDSRCSVC